jgi:acetyl esterase
LLKCGNRLLQLTSGLLVETPPTVWFQGRGDVLHDYKDADASFPGNEPQRFVANYRKAGGEIALEYIDAERPAGHSRISPRPATCSSAWSSSSIATLR